MQVMVISCKSTQIGRVKSAICECGQHQTMSHIVDMCPLTKCNGGLQSWHYVDNDTLNWSEPNLRQYSRSEEEER